jgi:hypothetical protein
MVGRLFGVAREQTLRWYCAARLIHFRGGARLPETSREIACRRVAGQSLRPIKFNRLALTCRGGIRRKGEPLRPCPCARGYVFAKSITLQIGGWDQAR